MQRERVQDQYPWTWEIPFAIICGISVIGVTVSQLARSLANLFAGAGWIWPDPGRLVTSVPALLTGDAAAGLVSVRHPADAATLWGWLVVVGLLTVTVLTVSGVWVWGRWGTGRMRGVALVTEAQCRLHAYGPWAPDPRGRGPQLPTCRGEAAGHR